MKTSPTSLKKGFIHLPVIIIILFLVVAFASVNALGFRDQKRGRPFNYLREYCKDKPTLNICIQLTRQTPKPTPTPVPSPTASPVPTNSPSPNPTISKDLTMHMVLLVPSDQKLDERYKEGIKNNMKKSQEFFAKALGGKTFGLNSNLIELRSTHPISWFYNCDTPNDCNLADDDFRHSREWAIWGKVRDDLQSFGLPALEENTLVAAFPMPGTYEFGTGSGFGLGPGTPSNQGMVILGDWKTAYAAGFDPPTDPDPSRCHEAGSLCAPDPALGAFIHEVGHALGLPHPEDPKDQDVSIMWSWWKYPNIGLSEKEKAQLSDNPAIR